METSYIKPSFASRVADVLIIAALLLLAFIVIYPFINLLALSFNDGKDAARGGIYFFPRKVSFSAYGMLFENEKLLKGLGWSVLRVVIGTGTCLFVTGLLSYIISIRTFSGRKFMRIIFFMTMYFSGGIIPTYILMNQLHLTNTFQVYWIPGLINAYFMLLMASYISDLPEALFESARIDGAGELRIYWRIVIPVAMPVFAAVSIYAAVGHWNSWFDVILYNFNGKFDTLQVYLRRLLLEVEATQQIRDQQLLLHKFQGLSPQTLRAATTVLVTVPILCVYPFLQKYFIGGITLGSVK
ncbi:carbohydrate ABC transporter permease [Paenibacillus lignilyticus]|uniref:Carbohydrate ABC transporter permease n=1 Tax=Paenibacillus lignilyticus TaxID=1172615 RepID=A0ABS5CGA1_9BACL|nr:carbohydrate ABC transporter permease [Paenibacillus lignilyticus]MBP3964903.1 carbohydrate ABC transporter permease [Paenibacillus lignilyticus]